MGMTGDYVEVMFGSCMVITVRSCFLELKAFKFGCAHAL